MRTAGCGRRCIHFRGDVGLTYGSMPGACLPAAMTDLLGAKAHLPVNAAAVAPTSTPCRPPPRVDTALATAAAAALSAVNSGTLKLTTQGTAPIVTTPAAGGALTGPASGG
jgi:hypothetical protein